MKGKIMKPETKIKKIMESDQPNKIKILKLYGVGMRLGNQYLAKTIRELVNQLEERDQK